MSTAELIERIRPLPAEEKRALLERVWEEFGEELNGVDPELTPEQVAELDRRAADALKHPGRGTPVEQVGADPTLTPEQIAELDRRVAEFEKTPESGIPWEQVKAEMRQRFGW